MVRVIPNGMQPHILYEFKIRNSLERRTAESQEIMIRVPDKIPVIVEEVSERNKLPSLARRKLLVPRRLTAGQLVHLVRSRLRLLPDIDLLVVMGDRQVQATDLMGHIYDKLHDPDGFLYIAYTPDDQLAGPKCLMRLAPSPPPPPTTPTSSEEVPSTPSIVTHKTMRPSKSPKQKKGLNKATSQKSMSKSVKSAGREGSMKRQAGRSEDEEGKKKKQERVSRKTKEYEVKSKTSEERRPNSVKQKNSTKS